jgi:hypothetical protein
MRYISMNPALRTLARVSARPSVEMVWALIASAPQRSVRRSVVTICRYLQGLSLGTSETVNC